MTLLIIAAALTLTAQDEPVFRGGTSLVRVDVQVIDRGKPVTGLTAEDFIVREEGAVKAVTVFAREAEPVQILFVLDVSGSMTRLLHEMATVSQQALQTLKPSDEAGVLLFARRNRLAMDMTTDRRSVLITLRDAPTEKDLGGGSSLYDALMAAAEYFEGLPPFAGRRAILVWTDNGGVSRDLPHLAVLRRLSAVNVVVSAAVTKDAKPPEPPAKGVAVNPDYTRHDIFLIADKTGGETVRMEKVSEQFTPLLERIRTRYMLGYKPPPSPGGQYRRIAVELTPAARSKLKQPAVHARTGYFTAQEDPQ